MSLIGLNLSVRAKFYLWARKLRNQALGCACLKAECNLSAETWV